jgi:hypothetical protein
MISPDELNQTKHIRIVCAGAKIFLCTSGMINSYLFRVDDTKFYGGTDEILSFMLSFIGAVGARVDPFHKRLHTLFGDEYCRKQ